MLPGKELDTMKNNKADEIDWKKIAKDGGVGSSKPKKNYKEIRKGFWLLYLFLCLVFFLGIIADIIDGTNDYIGSIKFFILFFIPCVIYLIFKEFKAL